MQDNVKLNRFISLDEALDEAATLCPGFDTMDRLIAKQWVYRAVREIGPNISWVVTAKIPVKQLAIAKPQDMFEPLDISLLDNNNCEVSFAYRGQGRRIHAYQNLIADGETYAPNLGSPVELSEDGYCFFLSSNATDLVTYALIKYLKLPVDKNGDLIIPEDQQEAINMHIRWKWLMRSGASPNEIELARQVWKEEKRNAISTAKMPSQLSMTELARKWNSLIHKPYFKTF